MDQQENYSGVTAIVPAYNEADRIGSVLEILCATELLDEVIVVDDGSTDNTKSVVQKFPVQYLRLSKNGGKGAAMERGVEVAKHEVIFFCDADIRGLLPSMIEEMVKPVLAKKIEMFVAMRNRKVFVLRFLLAFIPLLGGERVLTKKLWKQVPAYYKDRFRIEAALNFYAKYHGQGFRFKVFPGLTQTIKEKKYGWYKGIGARIKMMRDYLFAQIRLEFLDIPRTVSSRRRFILKMFSSVFFLGVGVLIFVGIYFGPRAFLFRLFEKRIATDPSTPIIDFFLSLTGRVSVDGLLVLAGLMVLVNALILLVNLGSLVRIFYKYMTKWRQSVLLQIQTEKNEIQGEKKEI